jgi:predicted cupin superfamily sugar epimerase
MMIAAEGCAMVDELTADEIRALLRLEPHATCGSVRMTYLSPQSIAAGGLPPPFSDPRPMGSALYFMVTPTAPVQLHRIRNDQLYHYYLGDPLEVLLLRSDGTSDRVVVGPNLRGGEYLQLFIPGIPGDTFHTARVMGPMVPWREHRVAGRRARRRRDRQTQGTGGEISVDCP